MHTSETRSAKVRGVSSNTKHREKESKGKKKGKKKKRVYWPAFARTHVHTFHTLACLDSVLYCRGVFAGKWQSPKQQRQQQNGGGKKGKGKGKKGKGQQQKQQRFKVVDVDFLMCDTAAVCLHVSPWTLGLGQDAARCVCVYVRR